MIMIMSLANAFFRVMISNGGLDFMSLSNYFSITSGLNLIGQVLFLIGLYQFGTSKREELYDDLLDDLPD